eukprot:1153399-Pelagomonas_calceolata.AAC.1
MPATCKEHEGGRGHGSGEHSCFKSKSARSRLLNMLMQWRTTVHFHFLFVLVTWRPTFSFLSFLSFPSFWCCAGHLEGWQGGCRAEQREGGHRGQEGELLELGPPSISAHSPEDKGKHARTYMCVYAHVHPASGVN